MTLSLIGKLQAFITEGIGGEAARQHFDVQCTPELPCMSILQATLSSSVALPYLYLRTDTLKAPSPKLSLNP